MDTLSHLDSQGRAHMVDVSAKPVALRHARATGFIRLRPETCALVKSAGVNFLAKGSDDCNSL